MNRLETVCTVVALVVLLAFSGGLLAAPPPGKGGGSGGGGGGDTVIIPDLGDLIILYRYDDGVPIPSPETQVIDPETGLLVDGGLCWQPIAFNVSDDPDTVCPLSCVVDSDPPGTAVVDVNQYNCGVATGCSGCTQEVDFGRSNVARSPSSVFDQQLEDVIVNLATADCVTLDPAGRLVTSRVADDLSVSSSAIDSPLQNLAIYRQLMLTGTIGAPLPEGAGTLITAARALGAASDKTGEVNVDKVAYLNQIMGLSDPAVTTTLAKLCETYREEVQGVIQLVEKCFLDYGAHGYFRAGNFRALPAPAYIPYGAAVAGMFEYLAILDENVPSFTIGEGPIGRTVFLNAGFTGGNIGGFAQAADDTRAVIDFMHSNPLPANFITQVPCDSPSDDTFYDLSISEQSGLQVPKNYVSGGEREFFVNVANLGPDTANGTVTVNATANGEVIDCGEATGCTWTLSIEELLAGQTDSFNVLFTITTTSDTINWEATVAADSLGTDPNSSNNSVDAVSSVRSSGRR